MNLPVRNKEQSASPIPVRNAWHMLLYSWELARFLDRFEGAVENSPTMLGLLARILAESTERLLRRELARSFETEEATIRGIRGRIDFAASTRQLHFEAGRACCRFSRLDVDTLRNQVIRSTLGRLAGDPRLDHVDPTKAADLRRNLYQLTRTMSAVSIVPVSAATFRRIDLGRNDASYQLPIAVCKLLHRLQLPTESTGDHAMAALLRDRIAFHSLFESFVRNFWRLRLRNFSVERERLKWFDELNCEHAPSMATDITLTSIDGLRRVVVDTKFYRDTLDVGQFGDKPKFHSENLYQMYAYLRTQEHRGEAFKRAEGILLYPTTSHEVDSAMLVQGHRIRVVTLDLAKPWQEIETRLLSLLDPE